MILQLQVNCADYSFDFEFDTPVISAFKITSNNSTGERFNLNLGTVLPILQGFSYF